MSNYSNERSHLQLMPVDVFEGGAGNLVLCQAWPSLDGERYLRILLPMAQARSLAEAILAIERDAKRKRSSDGAQ